MAILDHLPSLTHINAETDMEPCNDGEDDDDEGETNFNDEQRRQLFQHESLTSIGGSVWENRSGNLTSLIMVWIIVNCCCHD
jgi:hypothetical protein